MQVYNLEQFAGFRERAQHPVLQDNMKQIEAFQRVSNSDSPPSNTDESQEVNEKVVQRVLRLLAIVLGLTDENLLAEPYDFSKKGEDMLRYLKYEAIPVEDSEANNGIYANKHTDMGTLTLNFAQPVAGLQILDENGEWKWIKPWEEEIVVNCADALAAMTGGYFKSGVHRVHAPPKEQIHLDRWAALFFSRYPPVLLCFRNMSMLSSDVNRPNSRVMMDSLKDSPVLQRAKSGEFVGTGQGLNGDEWSKLWLANMKEKDALEAARKQKELEAR